jgi:hypothetical protein
MKFNEQVAVYWTSLYETHVLQEVLLQVINLIDVKATLTENWISAVAYRRLSWLFKSGVLNLGLTDLQGVRG